MEQLILKPIRVKSKSPIVSKDIKLEDTLPKIASKLEFKIEVYISNRL
jgi:hypothetical protein